MMKKPNYSFQKRMKEMKRAKKSEEKRQRRLNKGNPVPEGGTGLPPAEQPI